MAKTQQAPSRIIIPGVTNYSKLKNINDKKTEFNRFNPFMSQAYSEAAKKSHEAESLDERYLDEDIYNQLLMMNGLRENVRTGQRSSYYGLSRKAKRMQMIKMSIHDVIDEVLTKLTDEVVVNSQQKSSVDLAIDIAKLTGSDLTEDFIKQIKEYAEEEFDRIINMFGFNQSGTKTSFWNKVYLLLIEGTQAYELVWDDINDPKKIIAIHEIDALETEEFYVRGVKYWKHHKNMSNKEQYIILYDTQVVSINWSDASPNNRTSYLEQLLKPFNDLRIMDESTLTWTVTNAVFRLIVTVPTKGKSRIASAQSLATEKGRYNDDITYNSDTGELSINGTANQMMMKTYWMADGDSGTPDVKGVKNEGPELTDMTRNEYFSRRYYRAARIPYSRFDASSAESWNLDARTQLREEITFGRFVQRIREIVQMLLLKPLYFQLAAKFEEIRDDSTLLEAFSVRFNSYSVFEELMHLDVMSEKLEVISNMYDKFTIKTPDGQGEQKYFSLEFLIGEYLPELSPEKIDLNKKMSAAEVEKSFELQLRLYKLQAKYDPALNIDPATGKISSEVLSNLDDEKEMDEDTSVEVKDTDIEEDEIKVAIEKEKELDKTDDVEEQIADEKLKNVKSEDVDKDKDKNK